jgi:AAHS family 4-hydroxybenzoate transporter-like MFS transporter
MTGAFAIVLLFTLPESARWMVAKERPRSQIAPALSRFDPGLESQSYDRFVLSDERVVTKSENPLLKLRELFVGGLAPVTLMIWAAYFCSSFAIYLKSSYGVLFMEALGIERQNAAWLGSIGAILGALGGVALLAFTERRGPGWITLAPLIGIPFVLLVGTGAVLGGPAFIPVLLIGSVMVGAGHAAVISITSVYYPSAVRATGGGWASFMAKFAAVAAPNVGAAAGFLQGRSGAMDGYIFTVACLAGIVIFIFGLSFFSRGLRQGHASAAQPAE